MPKTSSLITGGLTVSAAELVPAVEWILGGCRGPVPASVSSLVAGLVAAGIHAAYNFTAARSHAKPGQSVDNRQFVTTSIVAPAGPVAAVPGGVSAVPAQQ